MPSTTRSPLTAPNLKNGSRTDPGAVRPVNEDAVLSYGPVHLVADGMGGHEAGDRASAAVVAAFMPLTQYSSLVQEQVTEAIAIAQQNVEIIALASKRGAGSTLSGFALIHSPDGAAWILVFNIGDSRVYRLSNDRLEQITVDHSLVQEMVDSGSLTPQQAADSKQKNVITRAVGNPDSPADYWLCPVVNGDRYLVCSDGLSNELSSESLRAGLSLGGPPHETAHSLVERAIHAGGHDNISAVVVDVTAGGLSPRSNDVTGTQFTSELVDTETLVSSKTIVSRRKRER